MKFADRLKFTASGTSAATITVGAAVAGCRSLAQAIADGALAVNDAGVPFTITDGTAWEDALFTVTSGTVLTRTSTLASSAGGTTPATFSAALTVFNAPPASYLAGQSVADYLAANDAGTLQNTDVVAVGRGSSLFSTSMLTLANKIAALWPASVEAQLQIGSTASFPLDFTTHNRRRIICTAAPAAITAPSTYSNAGNGFSCKIENLSGAAIPLTGMSVRPSGTSIPVGGSAEVYGTNGALYANLSGVASAGNATVETLAISAVSSPQTVNTAYTISGTWSGVQPTALDYAITDNGGTQGAWNNAVSSLVINAGGTWSFSVTPTVSSTSRTMQVRDHNATSVLTAQSNAYVVNAAAGGATAPFTAVAGTDFQSSSPVGTSFYYWQAITPTGSATFVSAIGVLSESKTVAPPTTGDNVATGAVGTRYFAFGPLSPYGGRYIQNGNGSMGIHTTPVINFYYWLFLTDSNGAVWKFVYPNPIAISDTAPNTTTNATQAGAQVQ